MFLTYIVLNNGIGVYGTATHDLSCLPSECFWLIPGTWDLIPDPDICWPGNP